MNSAHGDNLTTIGPPQNRARPVSKFVLWSMKKHKWHSTSSYVSMSGVTVPAPKKKNASSECQQPQQYIIHAHDHSAANRGISAYNSVEVKKHQRSKCGMAMPIEMRSKIPRRFCIKLFLYPSHSLREALGSLSRVSPAAITLENYDADVFLEFNWISSRNRQGGLPSYQK